MQLKRSTLLDKFKCKGKGQAILSNTEQRALVPPYIYDTAAFMTYAAVFRLETGGNTQYNTMKFDERGECTA